MEAMSAVGTKSHDATRPGIKSLAEATRDLQFVQMMLLRPIEHSDIQKIYNQALLVGQGIAGISQFKTDLMSRKGKSYH